MDLNAQEIARETAELAIHLAADEFRKPKEAIATAVEIVLVKHGADPGASTPANNVWD